MSESKVKSDKPGQLYLLKALAGDIVVSHKFLAWAIVSAWCDVNGYALVRRSGGNGGENDQPG
jgi:hypothetical protein